MIKHFPLRLRKDWLNAYSGFESTSEPVVGLSENRAYQFFRAAGAFAVWQCTDGLDVMSSIESFCRDNSYSPDKRLRTAVFNFANGSLRRMDQGLLSYIQSETSISNKALKRRYAEEDIDVRLSSHRNWIPFIQHIKSNKGLSCKAALNHYVQSIKPQYSQTALLHTRDGFEFVLECVESSNLKIIDELNISLDVMDREGLTKAIEKIRELVPYENTSEKQQRLERHKEVKTNNRNFY